MTPTNDNAGGTTFTVPDSTQNAMQIKVASSITPHVGIDKAFNKVTKSTEKVNGRTTFDQAYTVMVTNPSVEAGLTYSLDDAWQIPTRVTVHEVSISGGAINGIEAPQVGVPYVEADISLPIGQKYTYTVVLSVSGPDIGLLGIQGTYTLSAAGQGKVIYNKISVTTKGDGQSREAVTCDTLPTSPQFRASKTPPDVVRSDDDTFTFSYMVTVISTSLVISPVIVNLADTPQMPAGAYLHKVWILEKGADAQGVTLPERNDAIGTFSELITLIKGGAGESLAAASQAGADGGSHIFTVQMTLTVHGNTPSYNESDFQYSHQRANDKPSGLVDIIVVKDDTDGEGSNHSYLSTDDKLRFSKGVTTQPGNGSAFDIAYTVSVANERSLTMSTGPINGKPSFAPGLNSALVKTQREMGPTRTVQPQVDGSHHLSGSETLYSDLTIRYTATLAVGIDPSAIGYNDELLACTMGKGRPAPNHGLCNKVVPWADKDSDTRPDHGMTCANVSPSAGKRIPSIVKTDNQDPLDDTAFDLYPTDPPTLSTKPPADGVIFIGDEKTGIFTTMGPAISRRYWLVKTEVPAGHQLMAKLARFRMVDTSIELIAATPGGSVLTISRSGVSRSDDTIIVRDLQIGILPLSGGRGIGMSIAVGITAIAGVGLLTLRRREASSFGCSA